VPDALNYQAIIPELLFSQEIASKLTQIKDEIQSVVILIPLYIQINDN
jgi:hypothetical protein